MTIRGRFKKIFQSQTPVQRGSIVKVSGASIWVSSPTGLREFRVTTPGAYKVGNKVRFQGSTLFGLIPSDLEGTIHVV